MITTVNLTRTSDSSMMSQMEISADIVIVENKQDGNYKLTVVGRESQMETMYTNGVEVRIIQSRKF